MEMEIIEYVKRHRILYDKSHPQFHKNRPLKALKWNHLADQLGVNVEIVKNRWKTLRDRFHRLCKTENDAREKYQFFNALQFLADCEVENMVVAMSPTQEVPSPGPDELSILEKLEGSVFQEIIELVNAMKSTETEQTPVRVFAECYARQVENANLTSNRLIALQIKCLQAFQEEIELQNTGDCDEKKPYIKNLN